MSLGKQKLPCATEIGSAFSALKPLADWISNLEIILYRRTQLIGVSDISHSQFLGSSVAKLLTIGVGMELWGGVTL